jgi:hypothetical protein
MHSYVLGMKYIRVKTKCDLVQYARKGQSTVLCLVVRRYNASFRWCGCCDSTLSMGRCALPFHDDGIRRAIIISYFVCRTRATLFPRLEGCLAAGSMDRSLHLVHYSTSIGVGIQATVQQVAKELKHKKTPELSLGHPRNLSSRRVRRTDPSKCSKSNGRAWIWKMCNWPKSKACIWVVASSLSALSEISSFANGSVCKQHLVWNMQCKTFLCFKNFEKHHKLCRSDSDVHPIPVP